MKRFVSFMLLWALAAGLLVAARAESVVITQESLHQAYEVDGQVLAELNATVPQLSGTEDAESLAGINAAIRDFVRAEGEYDNICQYALTDYRESPGKFAENAYGLEANVRAELLADGSLLSVRFDLLLSTGGPHPWDVIAAQHYFLGASGPVPLESLLLDPEATRALVAREAARWNAESGFEAFEEADLGAWTPKQGLLTGEGLLVFYNEGEIGPVSSGPLEFTISYARLVEHLSFDLLPLPENPTEQELLKRMLAKALYLQASSRFDEAYAEYGDYEGPQPGDEGYETYARLLRDVERAIQLDPTLAASYYLLKDVVYAMNLYDEGNVAKARGYLLENPEDEMAYLDLIYALQRMNLYEEAAGVYGRMLIFIDPPGETYAYQKAEALFAAGEYEACLPLYEEAVEEERYTTLALMHRQEALMGLERYGDALAAAREGGTLTDETFLFDAFAAEAYMMLGDVWSARRMLWETLSLEPDNPRACAIMAAIEKMLPAGAEEAFAAERWDGWEVVATGFYEESPQPYTVVAILRKGEDNVLCVLRRTSADGGYTIFLENDRALYPGDRTPDIYYEGHEGEFVSIDYAVELGRSVPGHNGFCFYNDEESEKDEFEFFWAYREIPEPGNDGYEDRFGVFHSTVDVVRYEISGDGNGALSLTFCRGDTSRYWGSEREFLAEVEGNPKSLTLASFDIAECVVMFDSAMASIPTDEDIYGYDED